VSRLPRETAAALVCLALFLAGGCRPEGPPPGKLPTINALAVAKAAMRQYDANRDGRITKDELRNHPALQMQFRKVIGDVTVEKIAARIRKWQDWGQDARPVQCTVIMGGRPLAGATVTFLPEEFLGKHFRSASGVTDANGRATIRTADPGAESAAGVVCGFYRVEISKKEAGVEGVPAKYNAQTTLGQEVAPDAGGIHEGIVFALDATP
jgi:hypothetical protein